MMRHRAIDAVKAKLLEGYTLVASVGDMLYTDRARGVVPLLALLDGGVSLAGGVAADRVVGRAAAYLYCLLDVSEIYALIISEPALEVLAAGGIAVSYETRVPAIRNRTGDGFCPMESATRALPPTAFHQALSVIRETKAKLG